MRCDSQHLRILAARAKSQHLEHEAGRAVRPSAERMVRVGELARGLYRRIRYIARFIYWSVKHRSTEHAAWVCNFEGFHW